MAQLVADARSNPPRAREFSRQERARRCEPVTRRGLIAKRAALRAMEPSLSRQKRRGGAGTVAVTALTSVSFAENGESAPPSMGERIRPKRSMGSTLSDLYDQFYELVTHLLKKRRSWELQVGAETGLAYLTALHDVEHGATDSVFTSSTRTISVSSLTRWN